MRVQDLDLLFGHRAWAMDRILERAAGLAPQRFTSRIPELDRSLRDVLVHILDWEIIWRERCRVGHCRATLPKAEDFPDGRTFEARWRAEDSLLRSYLAGLGDEDLVRKVTYRRRAGRRASATLWHLLLHILMHGVHHRSEAGALLTLHGASPGDIDFLIFLRRQTNMAPDLAEPQVEMGRSRPRGKRST